MKTLEALGATPGGRKTKFHIIFLISKMEIMLLTSKLLREETRANVWEIGL